MIRIRPTNRADIATWAEMRQSLWPSLSSSEALAEIEALIKDQAWASFVAEDTDLDALVGFMELSQRPFANGCDTSPVAFLEGIWVQEPYRHKGIGRRLVQAAETWARQRGLKELGSDADIANTLSHRAHEGWGFEETERVVYFRKRL